MLASNRGFFAIKLSNDASQILRGPSLVAVATKCETKSAITRLYTRSTRSLRPTRGFRVGLLNDVTQILPRPNMVAMATKFETKRAITQLVWRNITEMLAPSRIFWQLT